MTHSKGALNDEFTAADFFRRYTTVGLNTNRPGIVHRLDRDTSGVLIGARTLEAAVRLKKQFAERKTKKYYLAIVDGILKQSHAKIDIPLGRNPATPSIWRPDVNGKPAQTIYKALAHRGGKSFVLLRPLTGRTHQLRVHLRHVGTPYSLEITIAPGDRRTFTAPVPREFIELFPEANDVDLAI